MRTIKFDKFEIDEAKRILKFDGKEVYLRDRDFDVLLFLIEHRHTTVSKYEIIEGVWNGTHVEDNSVARAIVNIRKALNEDASDPHLIKTVRGRGYLFLGDVVVRQIEKDEADPVELELHSSSFYEVGDRTPLSRRFSYAALILVVTGIAGLIWWNDGQAIKSLNKSVLFEDNFSSGQLESEKWIAAGESVRVSDGVARVSVDRFRKGGSLKSAHIAFDPQKPLTVKSRMRISYNKSVNELYRFVGAFGFVDDDIDSKKDGSDRTHFMGIKYAKAEVNFKREGKLTSEGFYLIKDDADLLDEHSHCSGNIGPRTDAIWGKWFNQTLYYEPNTKTLAFFINGEKKGEFPAGELPSNKNNELLLAIYPRGSFLHHSIEIDYIEVTQRSSILSFS